MAPARRVVGVLFGSSTMALLNQTVWYKNPSTGLTSEYRVVAVRCDNYVILGHCVLAVVGREGRRTHKRCKTRDEGDEGQETGVVPVPTP